jgi:hypothetical protein
MIDEMQFVFEEIGIKETEVIKSKKPPMQLDNKSIRILNRINNLISTNQCYKSESTLNEIFGASVLKKKTKSRHTETSVKILLIIHLD